jgi:peptidoglycan/xylan/chitin deacetylase (PgdA/CDA1 family)
VERKPLDVQKTQFLLAASKDHDELGERILEHVEDAGRFRAENTPPHRFDPPATVFVKRALQDGLPEPTRTEVLDELFAEIVGVDERSFADDVYLTADDCRGLVARGHEVVGHGWEHRRLGLLDEAEQRRELERTREFVEDVGGSWALCYPYGSRDGATLRLLGELGCRIGLTTDARRATREDPLLELPRIDTNDLQREAVEQRPSRGKLSGRP